jgi:hypothetical protein
MHFPKIILRQENYSGMTHARCGMRYKALRKGWLMSSENEETCAQPRLLRRYITYGHSTGVKTGSKKNPVIQQGMTSLEDSIHAAKLAESVEVSGNDSITASLLDMMKASVQASEKQAAELQSLTTRVATISSAPPQRQSYDRQNSLYTRDTRPTVSRLLKPTPQNQQPMNYARQASSAQTSGPRSFRQPARDNACENCGSQHVWSNCPAYGQQCY